MTNKEIIIYYKKYLAEKAGLINTKTGQVVVTEAMIVDCFQGILANALKAQREEILAELRGMKDVVIGGRESAGLTYTKVYRDAIDDVLKELK